MPEFFDDRFFNDLGVTFDLTSWPTGLMDNSYLDTVRHPDRLLSHRRQVSAARTLMLTNKLVRSEVVPLVYARYTYGVVSLDFLAREGIWLTALTRAFIKILRLPILRGSPGKRKRIRKLVAEFLALEDVIVNGRSIKGDDSW